MTRPTLYTIEILNSICDRLSEGEPLAQICRDEGMPGYSTVWDWQKKDKSISGAIARAREHGEDVIASNTRLIARKKGESTDDVQRDKLIIETDLKLLSKWNPKKYGDKTIIAGDKENPIHTISVTDKILDLLTIEQLEKIAEKVLAEDAST